MSTTFQSCPGCDSFILSDTASCPQCGHVFDAARASAIDQAEKSEDMKKQQMFNDCRKCGETIRAGLVRCWNCNSFVRADVENKYKEMQSTPQPIIFSESNQRKEFLTPEERERLANQVSVFDALLDDNEFTLRASMVGGARKSAKAKTEAPVDDDDGFELSGDVASAPTAAPTPIPAAPAPTSPASPVAAAPVAEAPAPNAAAPTEAAPAPVAERQQADAKSGVKADDKDSGDMDVDDLVGIALQDERDVKRRKREKMQEARSRKILLPCPSCGAWIRVRQEQGGKSIRCRQCKAPMLVPTMKQKKKSEKKETTPQIDAIWMDDLSLHVIKPTAVTLKPGSLEKSAEPVDACFHESGLHFVKYAAPKKSLFGKAAAGLPDVPEQKTRIREHVQKTGKIASLPFGELQSMAADSTSRIRLVQPVAEAHESMFAGVPVFGEGKIAIYLPLQLADNQQAFLSLPLSAYRNVSAALKKYFGVEVGAEANGVPAKEAFDINLCFFSEVKVEALKNVEYYENDPAFELEVAGFVCSTCGIAVTEEARARKKLGGAAGKGIAKAKCPKCSNKFGAQKAYKIINSPEDETPVSDEEDVSSVLRPKTPAPRNSGESKLTLDGLAGSWKMVSLGQKGDFAKLQDMTSAGIVFEITGANYVVKAADTVQEQGTIVLDNSQTPVHFDQELSDGDDKGKKHLGLIKLVDGQLHNCQADFGKDRPAGFDAGNADSSLAIFTKS